MTFSLIFNFDTNFQNIGIYGVSLEKKFFLLKYHIVLFSAL